MDFTKLSNYQLYEIIQNDYLGQDIRKVANDELDNRKLSIEEIKQLVAKHDLNYMPIKEDGLHISYKICLILFPFFIMIHSVISGRILAHGNKKKWRDYWKYICIGYLLWTLIILLFTKFYLSF